MMSENLQTITKSACEDLPNDDVDMLSNLHDSILCQIIFKLQTIEAVKTSLLSSRYKSLWKNITSLRFKESYFVGSKVRFSSFVSMVLFTLKSKSINKLSLKLDFLSDIYDVPFWFSAAIAMNVKVLKLHNFVRPPYSHVNNCISIPSCIYTSKTLVVLEISVYCSTKFLFLNVPSIVCLPNLTSLRLERVLYSSDDCVRRLISGCSSLEKLHIERDVNLYDGVITFTIDSPTVKSLDYYYFKGDLDSHFQDSKFELNAPALTYLYLKDRRTRDFSFVNLCSLESAELIVYFPRVTDLDSLDEKVVKLLTEVYNVNHLSIYGFTPETLAHGPAPEPFSREPSNLNINHLEDPSWLDGPYKSHAVYLSKDSSDMTHVMSWSVPKELPIYVLPILDTISVSGFGGEESEINMIDYILKNAKLLRKMTIREATSEAKDYFEFHEKILKLHQGSGRCEIIFS